MSEIVTIADDTGAEAHIQTAFGFNCFSYRPMVVGAPRETLWSAPSFANDKTRASGSGNPILFPFPGRIPGTTFHWRGKDYPQTAGDGRGNAIHGFVHERPWRVVARTPHSVRGEFHAAQDDPALAHAWPADFRLRVDYALRAGALHMLTTVDNPGQTPLPCGLGLHPYFRVPLSPTSPGADCLVQLPVTRRWELIDMLPTGKSMNLEDPRRFADGLRFADMAFDDVFAGLNFTGNECTARIVDREASLALSVSFDKAFRECVVYNPPHREAVCIEPYTCVPGAFGLADQGVDAGLRILAPGESFTARMTLRLERLSA